MRQLRLGTTPDELALTIALGLAIGVFPVLGTTTALCALVALRLRLNQPIIQLVNYVAYPGQLLGLIPFYRAGETLFGQPHLPLSIPVLIARFREAPLAFIANFGRIAAQGVVVWCLVALPMAVVLYFAVRPLLRRMITVNGERQTDN
jgi:uncharacterized protein (DUF2062 family)